jgi:serine kinase of HPr protein (carbohydrate metabolism regulator)
MAAETPTVHASAVLAGARAVLIRGAAGSGKSRLALALIAAAQTGLLRFARLVGDDRVHLEPCHGRLLVRPTAALAGLIEVRGIGIRRLDHEALAIVGLVVDLAAEDAERLPIAGDTVIRGIPLPRLAIAPSAEPLQSTIAALATPAGDIKPRSWTLRGSPEVQK